MRDDNIFKAASGLGGGVGMMGDTCGALLGASMMLSLKYGRGREDIGNFEKLKSSGVPVGKLYKWFEKEFGSATCHDIRTRFGGGAHYDFAIPWQRELAEEAGIFKKCSDLVGRAAAKTAEMLWEATEEETKGK
jgi:C_GCAxxG_C_C family probable redox protein